MRVWLLGAMLVCALSAGAASAQDAAAWRLARAAKWTAFQATHPDTAAKLAAVRSATATTVAAAGPAPATGAGPETVASLALHAAPAPYDATLDKTTLLWRAPGPPVELWDGADAPEMVVIPAGEYVMGPRLTETGLRNEVARHAVRIDRPLAVGKYPVTVGEFANFVAQTGHDAGDTCWTYEGIDGHIREGRNWKNPGFAQTSADPVLCVSWMDIQAYMAWLGKQTGHTYRVLSEAEYEYAGRGGSTSLYWWGDEAGANHANCDGCGSLWDNRTTSPVGSFAPNPFGLYDTAGDTWVWTSDCYQTNPTGPDPKPPVMNGGVCFEHAIRGGAWHGGLGGLRGSARFGHTLDTHSATLGFRLAREL